VTLSGVTLNTDPAIVGRQVRASIFKETYEEPERLLIPEGVRPGDRVLEAGGGIGFVSLLCARIVGAQNLLIYEPSLAMQKAIRANFMINGLEPRLRGRALTAKGGDVQLFVNGGNAASSLHRNDEGGVTSVHSDGIDAALAEWSPPS